MTFNPHTTEDREEMLAAVGVADIEDLFVAIPEAVRFPTLDLPPALTEMEAASRLQELASENLAPPGQDVSRRRVVLAFRAGNSGPDSCTR